MLVTHNIDRCCLITSCTLAAKSNKLFIRSNTGEPTAKALVTDSTLLALRQRRQRRQLAPLCLTFNMNNLLDFAASVQEVIRQHQLRPCITKRFKHKQA